MPRYRAAEAGFGGIYALSQVTKDKYVVGSAYVRNGRHRCHVFLPDQNAFDGR